jgi:hypothetical protein
VSVPSTTALAGKDGELAVAAKAVDANAIRATTAERTLFFILMTPVC